MLIAIYVYIHIHRHTGKDFKKISTRSFQMIEHKIDLFPLLSTDLVFTLKEKKKENNYKH